MKRTVCWLAAFLAAAPAAAQVTAPAPPAHHWSYHGTTGPTHWGTLEPEYATCDTGTRQSPINIPAVQRSVMSALVGTYPAVSGPLFNNGHTVQMDVGPGAEVTIDGRRYVLSEFHFHHPSEHTVQGRRYAAEVHMVHRDSTGAVAVLGTFITAGERDSAWTPLLAALPHRRGDTASFSGPVDLARLFHVRDLAAERVRTYPGSLTTPPCSQGVTWLVRETPIYLSPAQIARIRAAMHTNARPVQSRHGRQVPRVRRPAG
jgi:carbonic anhydrase